MALKDWLAKNISGTSGYGNMMGAEVVKGGIALGRTLYMGHGTRATPSDVHVFEDSDQMKLEGFELYCVDPENPPPMEDDSDLSRHTRAAGIYFASSCAFATGANLMKQNNSESFIKSLGTSIVATLRRLHLESLLPLIKHYNDLPRSAGIWISVEYYGVLIGILEEVIKQSQERVVAFRRTGFWGFEPIAASIPEVMVQTIRETVRKYDW
jgi:hypothetical protein